jgi:hypothetical protein
MTELTEDESQFHISLFRGMQHHLKQILAWKENLDQPQPKRHRNDCNDKRTIQTIRFWITGYLNGLILGGWIK